MRHKLVALPNIITFGRLLCIPFVVYYLLFERFKYALVFFMIAAVSDALDGFLARKMKAQSELGAYLDPLADKLLFLCTFVALSYLNAIPFWFAVLSISRDVFIVLGYYVARKIYKIEMEVRPLFISKVNTFVQSVLVVSFLFFLSFGLFDSWIFLGLNLLIVLGLITLFLSSLGYVYQYTPLLKGYPILVVFSTLYFVFFFFHWPYIQKHLVLCYDQYSKPVQEFSV
jgi:cardiolipin synthase